MKACRALIVFATILLSVLGVQPAAQACLTGGGAKPGIWPGGGRSERIEMDPVNFYIYDRDNNNVATVYAKSFLSPKRCAHCAPSLEYNINGGGWNNFSGPLNIDFGGADLLQVSLRLDLNTCINDSYIYGGDVTFMNAAGATGSDLYQKLLVRWGGLYPLFPSMISSSAADPISSNVPIPASVLLLFSGLAGLVGFRRRMFNR